MSDIHVGCGLRHCTEEKGFASGTVVGAGVVDGWVEVAWQWSAARRGGGGTYRRYASNPSMCRADQLVLMSVPDHDHWPPNPLAWEWGRDRWYGWVSVKAAEAFGTIIWSTPSGGEVHVTSVHPKGGEVVNRWSGLVCVGEVVAPLRKGFAGKIYLQDGAGI